MGAEKSANFMMKVVVLGDSSVGKTSILRSYTDPNAQWSNGYKATVGSDLYVSELKVQGKYYAQLQMWDTAGQERFQSLSRQLYRGADVLVLVYDITDLDSFNKIEHWKNEMLQCVTDDDI